MSLLDWLWDFFRAPTDMMFLSGETLSGTQVREILKGYGADKIWIADEKYTKVHDSDILQFLQENKVSARKYLVDSHDCDDFSFELKGEIGYLNPGGAFGIIWGNRIDGAPHAWNFYINQDNQLKFVEPQTDEVFDPSVEKYWIVIL